MEPANEKTIDAVSDVSAAKTSEHEEVEEQPVEGTLAELQR